MRYFFDMFSYKIFAIDQDVNNLVLQRFSFNIVIFLRYHYKSMIKIHEYNYDKFEAVTFIILVTKYIVLL